MIALCRPTGFLANGLLRIDQQREQTLENASVHDDLRLNIITSDDVSDRAQSRRLHVRRLVHQQLDKTTSNTSLDDRLDLLILRAGIIRHVGQRPASIRQDLIVENVEQTSENAERRRNLVEIRLRLTATEVRQRPGGITKHSDLRIGRAQSEERLQRLLRQNLIAALRRVTCDVSKSPHGLLLDVIILRLEQLHKHWDRTVLDDSLRVL